LHKGLAYYKKDGYWPYDQLDPFRNIDRYQNVLNNPFRNEDLLQDDDILRGTENSYVTKINYDKDGNPIKEVLQTKVFHANDRDKKIMETEKRYVNDKLGEEKISNERILGDKAVKVVTKKSKNKPEETRTYLKGGLRDDQVEEFNREYDRVKNEIRHQQLGQQQYKQLGKKQDEQQYRLQNQQQQQQNIQQLDQNKNVKQQKKTTKNSTWPK